MFKFSATFVLASFSYFASFAHADVKALQLEYLQKCGGKYYSKCDGEDGRSQMMLFQAAREEALAKRQKMAIVFGADWCPACVLLHKHFDEAPDVRKQFDDNFVAVDLNVDMSNKSVKDVQKLLGVNIFSFPTLVIYDPQARRVLDAHNPKMDVKEEVAYLLKGDFNTIYQDQPDRMGTVRLSVLNRPLEPISGYGHTGFFASTRLEDTRRERFEELMRAGILYFHSFYYIDAYRAFKTAKALEPDNPIVNILLASEVQNLSADGAESPLARQLLDEVFAAKDFPLDDDDKTFLDYRLKLLCTSRHDSCGKKEWIGVDYYETAKTLKDYPFRKGDYMALIGYESSDIATLERAVKLFPQDSAPHHYLTHLYEGSSLISLAGEHAALYAQMAPNSPHAQHMYGHILPQLGKWAEGLRQFQLAEKLEQDEFAREGILPTEDWHFAHNRDLLVGTLVYLNRASEAIGFEDKACDVSAASSDCDLLLRLLLISGRYADAEAIINKHKADLEDTNVHSLLALSALGRRDFKTAVEELKFLVGKQVNAPYAFVVTEIINVKSHPEKIEEQFKQIETALHKTGFDSWSNLVTSTRVATAILRSIKQNEWADKIDAIEIAKDRTKVCASPKH